KYKSATQQMMPLSTDAGYIKIIHHSLITVFTSQSSSRTTMHALLPVFNEPISFRFISFAGYKLHMRNASSRLMLQRCTKLYTALFMVSAEPLRMPLAVYLSTSNLCW